MTLQLLPSPTWFVGCGNMGGRSSTAGAAAGIDLRRGRHPRRAAQPVDGRAHGRRAGRGRAAAEARGARVQAAEARRDRAAAAHLADLEDGRSFRCWPASRPPACAQRFPSAGAIVRAIPNLPVAVRRGVIALYSADADDARRQQLAELFAPLGFAPWMADEAQARRASARSPAPAPLMSRGSSPR